jgi:uncharacterized protein with ATP-grasp and redox domains
MNRPDMSKSKEYASFPLLAEPDRYKPCPWDLATDASMRAHWSAVFTKHFPTCLEEAIREGLDRGEPEDELRRHAQTAARNFRGWLDKAQHDPQRFGTHNILTFCIGRERVLRQANFDDPYRLTKQRENERALALLPDLLNQLDDLDPPARWARLIEGIFAGNIFDLGAVETASLFEEGKSFDFHQVRSKLKPRPWRVDDLDPWLTRTAAGPAYRSAMLFVDNAGPDVVLGMIPFARQLLRDGAHVILSANLTPSLNDITHDELTTLIATIANLDPQIARACEKRQLELVSSGNGLPLIDLSQVARELCDAVRRCDVDLLVIEGMGRALESNFDARFTCDTIKIGMIKDPAVAQCFDGEMYDLVFRFEQV